jgi:hypothetical protein
MLLLPEMRKCCSSCLKYYSAAAFVRDGKMQMLHSELENGTVFFRDSAAASVRNVEMLTLSSASSK